MILSSGIYKLAESRLHQRCKSGEIPTKIELPEGWREETRGSYGFAFWVSPEGDEIVWGHPSNVGTVKWEIRTAMSVAHFHEDGGEEGDGRVIVCSPVVAYDSSSTAELKAGFPEATLVDDSDVTTVFDTKWIGPFLDGGEFRLSPYLQYESAAGLGFRLHEILGHIYCTKDEAADLHRRFIEALGGVVREPA